MTLREEYAQERTAREWIEYRITSVGDDINDAAKLIHQLNEDWWIDLETGEKKQRNVGEALMLIVTELAEAMEGYRKSLQSDHLPGYSALEEELADTLIRICDLARGLGFRLGDAVAAKLIYNLTRPDHDLAARRAEGGKKV
jgi:NTP pyrophosphatase (non-canonical NTP hydrolase)